MEANLHNRGINEGRSAARDVDSYLMGTNTLLPMIGGIVQRPAYEIVDHANHHHKKQNGTTVAAA